MHRSDPRVGLDRRQILKRGMTIGAGLVVGFRWNRATAKAATGSLNAATPFAPNAFVRIAADDTVTVIAKHVEVGQGSHTGLATILAEELDADWSRIRVEDAPAELPTYANTLSGIQATGDSTAMANSWMQLRQAGATARAMLVSAAAAAWNVPAAEIEVKRGVVHHRASGKSSTFGKLADAASKLTPPAQVSLKKPEDFSLIGTDIPRLDAVAKSTGAARFTADANRPGMLTALIARPPRFGGKVKSFDASSAKKVRGVTDVVLVPAGVAVLAKGFWAAKKGRDALIIEWDESAAEKRGTDELLTEYRALLDQPGAVARKDGDPDAAFAKAARVLETDFEFPYLAHAPMETLDCVVELGPDQCQVWAGSQVQTIDQGVVAATVGLTPDNVKLHTLWAGGSFGRRGTPNGDIVGETASIAKAISGRAPVKLMWTREDDIRGGRYRPLYLHRLRAGLDDSGQLIAWSQRIVGQSIMAGTPFAPATIKDGVDSSSVDGATTLPYAIANLGVDLQTVAVGVPVLWWRSVGHTHNGYSTEVFLDQVAHATGRDPVDLRRELLQKHPRLLGVLELAAKKAHWGRPLPAGRARGVAIQESFRSYVAQVAEISLTEDGVPKTERVVCAVDCGTAINPDIIRAQMEGGIGFGLGTAMHNEILLDAGRVRQSNFNDYKPLRIHEMPKVEVHIVPSTEAPTGVGEVAVPPIAPAVANAFLALTGKPVTRLPFAHLQAQGA